MALGWSLCLLLAGCAGTEPTGGLSLDGPARVSVDRLGPVSGPRPVDENGHEVHGIKWSATPPDVARVNGDAVVAVGPGEATVNGEWQGLEVQWSLVVEPAIELRLVDPPGRLRPGESVDLSIQGRRGGEPVDPGSLEWRSSDPAILTVDAAGVIQARSPGLAYVSIKGGRAEAMVEIQVVP